jgi:protein-tyrosine phosphatase
MNPVCPYFCGMKILMVCLGNICRSPLAEGILRHKAEQAGLNWTIDSAGTSRYNVGCAPHHLSQKVAGLNGVSLEGQCARQFTAEDMETFDRIYVMDADNYAEVKRISGQKFDAAKVDFLLNVTHPGRNRAVPDPWYGPEAGYHEVYALIEQACAAIVQRYTAGATA